MDQAVLDLEQMSEGRTADEICLAREIMGDKSFWLGDEQRIQNVAKAVFYTYTHAHPKYRLIAMATVKEFITRRIWMIGPRQRLGLQNEFDRAYFQGL